MFIRQARLLRKKFIQKLNYKNEKKNNKSHNNKSHNNKSHNNKSHNKKNNKLHKYDFYFLFIS